MNETALVVIDVQNYFVNEHTKRVPERIVEYLEKEKPSHVLFTKFVNTPDSNFARQLNWNKCQHAPEIDFHPLIEPFTEEGKVFVKNSYSAFGARGFEVYLKKHRIREMRLCGIDTDSCVLATTFDAFDCGYTVKVLGDLSGSHSGQRFHEEALRIIAKNVG